MSRRVNYDWDVLKQSGVGPARKVGSAENDEVRGGEGSVDDKYLERLLQYVPAEVLAFFVAAQGLLETDAQRWVVLAVGALGVVLTVPKLRAMTWWTIPLCLIAFAAWAFGTTGVDEELFGWSDNWSALILVISVFLVPLIDRSLAQIGRGR